MFGLMDDSSQAYQDENQGEVFYDYPYIPEAQVAKRGEIMLNIINRPDVAGAVLQSPPSLIN